VPPGPDGKIEGDGGAEVVASQKRVEPNCHCPWRVGDPLTRWRELRGEQAGSAGRRGGPVRRWHGVLGRGKGARNCVHDGGEVACCASCAERSRPDERCDDRQHDKKVVRQLPADGGTGTQLGGGGGSCPTYSVMAPREDVSRGGCRLDPVMFHLLVLHLREIQALLGNTRSHAHKSVDAWRRGEGKQRSLPEA